MDYLPDFKTRQDEHDWILHQFESVKWTPDNRSNVPNRTEHRSALLGIGGRVLPVWSIASRSNQLLYKVLRRMVIRDFPEHKWSSLFCNVNFKGGWHRDTHNSGPSVLLVFERGMKGGGLLVRRDGGEERLNARFMDGGAKFDGNDEHKAEDFELEQGGVRVSVVVYEHDNYAMYRDMGHTRVLNYMPGDLAPPAALETEVGMQKYINTLPFGSMERKRAEYMLVYSRNGLESGLSLSSD